MGIKYTKDVLEEAVKKSNSVTEVVKNLGHKTVSGSVHRHISQRIKFYEINTSHFGKNKPEYKSTRMPENYYKYFEENSPRPVAVKKRLLKDGLREEKCERCGLTEWNGKPIPLQLHHKDGDRRNNNLENIEIICPNCHAQTDNYAGRKNWRK